MSILGATRLCAAIWASLGPWCGPTRASEASEPPTGDAAALAGSLLAEGGTRGGLVILVGRPDGRVANALGAREGFLVHGLARTDREVEECRARAREAGVMGSVAFDRWSGGRLPYIGNLANLVVWDDPSVPDEAEILRVLAPGGVALVRRGDRRVRLTKPRPPGIDDWTHYFHGPDGNPVARDSVVGPPRRLQWTAGPRWSRHHDHMASMTALVAAGGRVFYILDEGPTASIQLPARWRLIARDAFNGTILWKRDLESWNTHQWPLKSGPATLTRRLVAVGDRVLVTLGLDAAVSALDAATGGTLRSYDGSERTREILVSAGTLLAAVDTEPSRLPEWRRRDSYVWENSRRANADWAWKGSTCRIRAWDEADGELLWDVAAPAAPGSLASDGERAVFHDGTKLVCLARQDGRTLWESAPVGASVPVPTSTGFRTILHEDVVLFAGNNGKVSGFSARDGEKLWEGEQPPSGHQSFRDLLVVGGLAWSAPIGGGSDSGVFTGRDPRTGAVRSTFSPDVTTYWFHHRCYPTKGTDRFLLTSRTGVEFVDPVARSWEPHHWVRGGCIYGVLPANGLLYAPMQSCGCYLEAKLDGFSALAAGPEPPLAAAEASDDARLEEGPAHGASGAKPDDHSTASPSDDWPTYRHDPARSGATAAAVDGDLAIVWKASPGGRLTQAVVAGGIAVVASVDAHSVHAFDVRDGRSLWTFVAGGRIDSPPTLYRGLVLFGSADGRVYAVRASDGALAWRYLASPADLRLVAFDQVESVWPVHGSVLVHDGVLYATAGRSVFLDGGIRFLALDPITGRKIRETVWDERDPETGGNLQAQVRGLNMPVALSDVLSFDGTSLWMRSQRIDLEGRRTEIPVAPVEDQHAEDSHLFCQVGFLDDSWFHRSYWTYGRRVSGGYGGWAVAGRYVPAGRILAFDEDRVYGYGRKPEYFVNSSVLEYQLFAAEKKVGAEAARRVRGGAARRNERSDHKNADASDWRLRSVFPPEDLTAVRYAWRLDQPAIQARGLVVAGDRLFVAGHPDCVDERRAFRLPDDPDVRRSLARQAEAIEGKHGASLWVVAKSDGRVLARHRLPSPPVFDGVSAAGGRLFLSCLDGSVLCVGTGGGVALATEGPDEPVRTISEEPEDPGYLKPVEEDLSGEFVRTVRCRVVRSELGYRILPSGAKGDSVAVRRLAEARTGAVTLACRLRVPGGDGLWNGFLTFGDGPGEDRLVRCGVRIRSGKALIVEGPVGGDARTRSADVDLKTGQTLDLRVRVDLAADTVSLEVAGVTVEATLARPLASVTHVGYATDKAVAEFGPIEVGR